MIYSTNELVALSRAYMTATGIPASGLSKRLQSHARLIERLIEGYEARADTVARASDWFDANWPAGLKWPEGVPERRRFSQPYTVPPLGLH